MRQGGGRQPSAEAELSFAHADQNRRWVHPKTARNPSRRASVSVYARRTSPRSSATRPAVAFLEVHPENYFGGGPALAALERLRRDYPLSLHGVGLSLGGSDALDTRHLARLAKLIERLDPAFVSEHLAWSVVDGAYLNHLLPLPYDEESLDTLCSRVTQTQETLGRKILVENPSLYLRFRHSPISEPEFLGELARRTGCGILLDVNNIYVSCRNFEEDPLAYLDAMSHGCRRRDPSGRAFDRTTSTAGRS